MKNRHLLASAIIIGAALAAVSSQAATLDISYTTANSDVANLVLTTASGPSAMTFDDASTLSGQNGGIYVGGNLVPNATGYDILAVNGTRDTVPVTGLVGTAGSLQSISGYIYDNVSYQTNGVPVVDILGLEYTVAGGQSYNVYFSANNGTGGPGYVENTTPITSLSVSAVPLPATFPLFGAALAGLGALGRRRAKQRNARATVVTG